MTLDEIMGAIRMFIVAAVCVGYILLVFIAVIRSGELYAMFHNDDVKYPWAKEDKKRAKQEAKVKANKNPWER